MIGAACRVLRTQEDIRGKDRLCRGSGEENCRRRRKTAETLKKEALIEAKEKILRDKAESEKEIKERRNEVTRLERRAVAREETLEKKIESYERKEETLNRKIKEQSELVEKTEQLRLEQAAKLEAVAGLSRDEAKAELVSLIETEAKHEAAMRIVEIESQLKEDADKKREALFHWRSSAVLPNTFPRQRCRLSLCRTTT